VSASLRRLAAAVAGFAVLVAIGTVGYWALGAGRWRPSDCVYMTIITISTVGFYELREMDGTPGARPLTVGLIISGVGVLAYMQSNLTALLVEKTIGLALRRRRMQKAIAKLSGHVVVAGAGGTGKHVIEELMATQTVFVAIDSSEDTLQQVSTEICAGKMLYIHGDATLDHVLLAVGRALKDTPIRRETRALVVAVREGDRHFTYNPDPEHVIDEGTTLIVLGETESILKLRHLVAA